MDILLLKRDRPKVASQQEHQNSTERLAICIIRLRDLNTLTEQLHVFRCREMFPPILVIAKF